MGRVAKYKKLKACDPFSNKNGGKQSMTGMWGFGDNGRKPKKRSKTSMALRQKRKRPISTDGNAFDVPPSGGDDFCLSDLMKVKKVKPPVTELLEEDASNSTAQGLKASAPPIATNDDNDSDEDTAKNGIALDPMVEEKRAARILKIEPEQRKTVPKVERLKGESRKAFQKRLRSETRQVLKNEKLQQRNPEKRQRKKEFLNNKKKRKFKQEDDDESDDEFLQRNESSASDGFITGEQAVARAALGDQVERPPVFLQLPRGAKAKPIKSKTSKDVSEQAEQIAIENIRRKVQAQYEIVKAKRRKAGDFHL